MDGGLIMVLTMTSPNKTLDSLLSENKEHGENSKFIFFVTSQDITKTSDKISKAFPYKSIVGLHSYIFHKGAFTQKETLLLFIDTKDDQLELEYGLIENVSKDPAKHVLGIQKHVSSIHPGKNNTICVEFCTGGEERLLTTLNSVMQEYGIIVFGATMNLIDSPDQNRLFYNGRLYDDASVYLLIKNNYGRILTASQNIYTHHGDKRYIATKVNKETNALIEINGRPATEVYCEELGITIENLIDAFPYHPISKYIGSNDYLVSVTDFTSDGSLILGKQINQNDLICISDHGLVTVLQIVLFTAANNAKAC